jgi:protein-S-isoprenylcysteine O-methyltransferase Ste14
VARRLVALCVGATFVAVFFALLPEQAVRLNEAWGWPRWQGTAGRVLAVPLLLAGLAAALHCLGLFARIGRGTPVPLDPPRVFVASGLYRFSRNPMYVGYVAIALSYFLWSGELALLLYAALFAAGIHAWIVWIEEPGLRRRFGASYIDYTRRVPRWLGRVQATIRA